MPTPGRRPLRFDHVAEIPPEVDRLLAGYTPVGRWTLGQICQHLAAGFRYSIEGYPMRTPWLYRRTLGPLAFRWVSRQGKMPEGIPAPAPIAPKPDLDDRAEAEALRAVIALFQNHLGPMPENPVFGRLTRDQVARIHCIHAAHHLSFLLPAPASPASASPGASAPVPAP